MRNFQVTMQEEPRQRPLLEQVGQIWRRRSRAALFAAAIPLVGSIALVLALPRAYRSTALVLVEHATGAADDDVDARLTGLKNENLRRSRLGLLIGKFNLYHEMGRNTPVDVLIDQMQRDTHIDVDKEDRGGRSVAVAVHVTYTARDPRVAADVANELAAFYEREDLRMRDERASHTRERLQAQLADARQRLDEQEARLQNFKKHHLSELPEQVALHLAALEQLNSQIRASRPAPVSSGHAYGPQVGGGQLQHDERLDRLRELETRFTAEHPDVKRLKREIEMLPYESKGAVGAPDGAISISEAEGVADEPTSKARAENIRHSVDELKRAAAIHEQGIFNAPFRQQELEALLPDYVAARTRYQSLSEKAEIAALWDPRYDSGRLRVLDPAVPRAHAISPNVPRILAVGIALSLAAAVSLVTIIERIDTSFHTLDDLRSFTRVPVLASLPRLAGSTERKREGRSLVAVRPLIAAYTLIVSACFSCGRFLVGWLAQNRR